MFEKKRVEFIFLTTPVNVLNKPIEHVKANTRSWKGQFSRRHSNLGKKAANGLDFDFYDRYLSRPNVAADACISRKIPGACK